MKRASSATFFTACLLVFATPALAEPYSLVPSDNSAADQYAETFPGADGNHGVNNPPARAPQNADRRPGLTARAVEELSQSGPSGEAAAQVIERTSPVYGNSPAGDRTQSSTGRSPGEGNSAESPAPTKVRPGSGDREASGFGAAFIGLTDGGLGFLLPMALLTIAVATIALLTGRGRRS